jgi:hypothetical protein
VNWHHRKSVATPYEKDKSTDQYRAHAYALAEDSKLPSQYLQSSASNYDLPQYRSSTLNKTIEKSFNHVEKHVLKPIQFGKHHFWQKRKTTEKPTTEELIVRYQRRNTISLFALILGPFAVALLGLTVVFLAPFAAFGIIIGMIVMNLKTRDQTKGIPELSKQRHRAGLLLSTWLLVYAVGLLFWYALLIYLGGY